MTSPQFQREHYRKLADFRCGVRKCLSGSEAEAGRLGLPAQQHQAVLVIASSASADGMTLGELTDCLLLKPHSVLELVRRLSDAELVARRHVEADRRRVVVRLAPHGLEVLDRLASHHQAELDGLAPWMRSMLERLEAQA